MNTPHALIIDDNTHNLSILAKMLSLEHVDYTRVSDSTKVPGLLPQMPQVDLVFLDLEMPGMDGYTILDLLLADTRFQDVPIVAYTVHVSEINVARARGFHSFLAKPLDADTFPGYLARILKGERVWTRG